MNEVNIYEQTSSPGLLIEKYSSAVYRVAYSYTGNRNDAEDIMQDVFLRYLKQSRTFSSSEHEKAWFLRVTVNCCKSFHSSFWQKKIVPIEDVEHLADKLEENTSELPVFEAVMSLPPKQRLCVHLYYYEDLSIKDIAVTSGMPESTVKSHLLRARAALEQKLKGEYHA